MRIMCRLCPIALLFLPVYVAAHPDNDHDQTKVSKVTGLADNTCSGNDAGTHKSPLVSSVVVPPGMVNLKVTGRPQSYSIGL